MNLLIDIGNSRLKWAVQLAGHFRHYPAIDYRQGGYLQDLAQIWQKLASPQKLGIASVAAPEIKQQIMALAAELWPGLDIAVPVASGFGFGVSNAYQQPEKLGVDRWLALLAAHHYYPGHSCIVDCGTAITLDVLDADGQHLGGLICPGLQVMKKSLSAHTAALNFNSAAQPLGLANVTAAAIDSGTRYAALGMIEAVLRRLDKPCLLILCGGDAASLAGHLQVPAIIDTDLVFKGLSIILGVDGR